LRTQVHCREIAKAVNGSLTGPLSQFGKESRRPPRTDQAWCAAIQSSTTGAIRSRHLLPLKMP
jgi:hypothetical protein